MPAGVTAAAAQAMPIAHLSMAATSAPPIRLAVDCMGGDHGPSVTLPACRAFLAAHPAGRAAFWSAAPTR